MIKELPSLPVQAEIQTDLRKKIKEIKTILNAYNKHDEHHWYVYKYLNTLEDELLNIHLLNNGNRNVRRTALNSLNHTPIYDNDLKLKAHYLYIISQIGEYLDPLLAIAENEDN
jgi:hypothetical protein